MPDKDARIIQHDGHYRRGLVLGLTMAEIMVLILFTLLLALATSLLSRDTEIRKLARDAAALTRSNEGMVLRATDQNIKLAALRSSNERLSGRLRRQQEEIVRLKAAEEKWVRLQRTVPAGVRVEDVVQRLTRLRGERDALRAEAERLRPLEPWGSVIPDIVRELKRADLDTLEPRTVVERLREMRAAEKENENLRGQNAQLSDQIRRSGRGNEFPSCWATPEGRIESIFEITFHRTGIVVSNRDLPHRSDERAALPLSQTLFGAQVTRDQFRQQFAPLYRWSVERKCRFYVIMYSTAPEVRADYVNAVNAFFYPDSQIKIRPHG